jgi:tetratricopeptide (TPR) repeat protein
MHKQANDAFKVAVSARPKDANLKVRWGRLFLDGLNKADAAKLFQEAMTLEPQHAGAKLGLALVASESFEKKAIEMANSALETDPKLLEAQELLAKLAVEDVNFDQARKEAEKALKISDEALDAMAVLGALDVLADKKERPWLDRMDKINPVYSEGYAYIAHALILNRRYTEAIDYFKTALTKNPKNWEAHSELGITYMRLAMEGAARKHLELAYENNRRDPQTVNSLTLMDSYKNYKTFESPGMELRLHNKEADLLRLYIEPELKKAIATYEKKYKFKLDKPVRLEVYPLHEDFAVRTMGMPGLGALGVAFGYVVAMDSPSGRKPGSFHWASTMWHELSHVFVLGATHHRVPRWFTEGLAVHEETAVSPEWGDRLDPTALRAVKDKKLLPIAELDRGFIRPTYPNQVIVSYFQAGKICDYIAGKWGFQKLLDMMNSFAQTTTTPAVVEKHLGMKAEEFDKEFLAWLDKQLATPLAKFEDWRKRMKEVAEASKEKKWDEVIKIGTEIRDWYPDFVELLNVYEYLAQAHEEKGDKKSAAAELERYAKQGGRFPDTLKHLAELQEGLGRPKDAIATLERINYVYPVSDAEMHQKLGDLSLSQSNLPVAIREFQAALASKPPDPATSHYQLAQAYMKMKSKDKAMEHVVAALELAPGYRPAQKLLLELTSIKN